jgi:hypothetical protein
MMRGLAQLFDDIAITTMIRSLRKELAVEYEQSGHDTKAAGKLARQEISISIRASKLDVDCYQDVRAWKTSYMTERAKVEST